MEEEGREGVNVFSGKKKKFKGYFLMFSEIQQKKLTK